MAQHRLPRRKLDRPLSRKLVGLFAPDDQLVGTYETEQAALIAAWAAQPASVQSHFRGLSTRAVRYMAKAGWKTLPGFFVDRGTGVVASWKLLT